MRIKKDVNKITVLARNLQGLQTISSISKKLEVKRKTAVNYVYELRKGGFVKTTRGRKKIRVYEISPVRKKELGYPGMYDIINRYSPIKLVKPYEHRVHGKPMSIEEAIVRAIKTGDFRTILASLALFSHVKDWSLLYECAKKEDVRRQAGAMYDLSRKALLVRRIDRRIERRLLEAPIEKKYLIPNVKSSDFKDVEKKWRVFIPFRKEDLRRFE